MRGGGRPNKTGFIGVSKQASCRRWRAMINLGFRMVHIGTFKTPEDAARAYDVMARKHGKARLNFPELDQNKEG